MANPCWDDLTPTLRGVPLIEGDDNYLSIHTGVGVIVVVVDYALELSLTPMVCMTSQWEFHLFLDVNTVW